MTGYNDARFYGASNTVSYQAPLESAIVWLTSGNKMLFQNNSDITYTGNWNNTAVYGGQIGKYSQSVGDTASFSITGSTIYISSIRLATNAGGAFNVTVDGIDQGTYSCSGLANTCSQLGYAPFLVRITGLSDTTHNVVITHTVEGTIYLDFAATPTAG